MRSIEESTRAALEDLDYVLGVLREEQSGTAPTRTLADLPELLDRLRHAGAVVEPELSGELAQVQGTLSRAAYRILQEGLTNALRHGAGGPIEIKVAAGPDGLDLTVVNRTGARTGPGAFPTSGHGLPGLAERQGDGPPRTLLSSRSVWLMASRRVSCTTSVPGPPRRRSGTGDGLDRARVGGPLPDHREPGAREASTCGTRPSDVSVLVVPKVPERLTRRALLFV
ncbi:sensor histidine kinase [Streptomyces sp. NBC_00842]|uniref:sensor histidine kinase n=1 Tax=unclassified Streptomyces TaxID=2593676 RepID=UPI00386DCF93